MMSRSRIAEIRACWKRSGCGCLMVAYVPELLAAVEEAAAFMDVDEDVIALVAQDDERRWEALVAQDPREDAARDGWNAFLAHDPRFEFDVRDWNDEDLDHIDTDLRWDGQ